MAEPDEMCVEATVDRYAENASIRQITPNLLAQLRADVAAAGMQLVGDTVEISVHHKRDADFLSDRQVVVRVRGRVEPVPRHCPHADHKAPDPTDGPTSCPCGLVTRHPAPPKENPRV